MRLDTKYGVVRQGIGATRWRGIRKLPVRAKSVGQMCKIRKRLIYERYYRETVIHPIMDYASSASSIQPIGHM